MTLKALKLTANGSKYFAGGVQAAANKCIFENSGVERKKRVKMKNRSMCVQLDFTTILMVGRRNV